MRFYTTEKSNSESNRKWELSSATTLRAAKIVSRRRQMFCGTVCAVGTDWDIDGNPVGTIACRREDGTWNDYDSANG